MAFLQGDGNGKHSTEWAFPFVKPQFIRNNSKDGVAFPMSSLTSTRKLRFFAPVFSIYGL
jgi:hypothetical protein